MNLSINLNKISLLRNSRGGDFPSITEFGQQLLDLGIDGLTLHPRPDLRHATPKDCEILQKLCHDKQKELNLEGNPASESSIIYPGFLNLVRSVKPTQVTLVPDDENQITSDHGYTKHEITESLIDLISNLSKLAKRISIFVDAGFIDLNHIKHSGIDCIEIYTGPFAAACNLGNSAMIDKQLALIETTFQAAKELGIRVHIGHDLNLENLTYIQQIGKFDEASIGHAFIVDCIRYGIVRATELYLKQVK